MLRNQIHKIKKNRKKSRDRLDKKNCIGTKIDKKKLKNTIIPYSAMKIKANSPPPYSVLKPDTSSLSPSAKSKGVRFVSATQQTNSTTLIGRVIKLFLEEKFKYILISKLEVNKKKLKNNKAKAISYEIVCATPRILPKRAYLELDLHPLINIG